jgi:ammonia channel protein AmtB
MAFMLFQMKFAIITPACDYVGVLDSALIGAIGSAISYFSIKFAQKFKIPDALDVWACHGMAGTWAFTFAPEFRSG